MQYDSHFSDMNITKQMWDNHLVGLALLAPSGHYADVNRTFCKIFQRDSNEIIGKHYAAFITKEAADVSKYLCEGVLQGVLPSYEMQKPHVLPNGGIEDILIGTKALKDKEGNFICFFSIAIKTDEIRSMSPGIGIPVVPMTKGATAFDDMDRKWGLAQKVMVTVVAFIGTLTTIGGFVYWAVHAFDLLKGK